MREHEPSDAELLAAAPRDAEAFGELYDRYAATAFRWGRRAGLGDADALDLVGELFAQAWIPQALSRPGRRERRRVALRHLAEPRRPPTGGAGGSS